MELNSYSISITVSLLSHFHVRNTFESITVNPEIHTAVPQKAEIEGLL